VKIFQSVRSLSTKSTANHQTLSIKLKHKSKPKRSEEKTQPSQTHFSLNNSSVIQKSFNIIDLPERSAQDSQTLKDGPHKQSVMRLLNS
jgi:hypothetical protein